MAQAGNHITYCSRCSRLIPPSEMVDTLRMGDHVICFACTDAMSEAAKKAAGTDGKSGSASKHATPKTGNLKAAEVTSQSHLMHCTRCSRWITAEDKLDAIETPAQLICPTCASTLSPEAKAALLKEAEELTQSKPKAKPKPKPKAKGKRQPSHVMKSPLAAKKSGGGGMATFAAVGVAAAVIAILIAISSVGGKPDKSRRPVHAATHSTAPDPDDVAGAWGGAEGDPVVANDPEPVPVPADDPVEAPVEKRDLTAELDGLRPADGTVAKHYASSRRSLAGFVALNPDTPEAAEAKRLVTALDTRYREEAEDALCAALTSAEDLATEGKYDELRTLLAQVGTTFDEGGWYAKEGKPKIDEALAYYEKRESVIDASAPDEDDEDGADDEDDEDDEDEKPDEAVVAPVVEDEPVPDTPLHYITNGSMSDGENIPDGWTTIKKLAPGTRVSRDTKNFYGGPAALCLESQGGQIVAVNTFEHPALPGKRLAITGHMRCSEQVTTCLLIVRAYAAGNRKLHEETSGHAKPGEGWSPLSIEFQVPEKAEKLRLMFACVGNGKAWLDEVRVFDLDRADEARTGDGATGNLAPNGAMTDGDDLPTGWNAKNKGGNLAYRDTTTYVSAPASLCAESKGDMSAANLALKNITGPVTISGHIRTSVKDRAATLVQLHVYGKNFKSIWRKEIARVQKADVWKPFKYQTVIPENAEHINLIFIHTANGKSWLDDLSIIGGSATVAGKQIVKNGSATEGGEQVKHWDQYLNARVTRDTTVYHTGPASIRVAPAAGSCGCAVQHLPKGSANRFLLSAWIKTSPGSRAEFKTVTFGPADEVSNWVAHVSADTDWKQYSLEFVLPETVDTIHVEIYAHEGGQVWVDDITLYAIGQ